MGELSGAGDLEKLRYTASVIAETLRLYPPVWILARRALEADTLPTGVRIPKGAELVVVVYAVHRNPRYFPEPELFDPDRFSRPAGDGVPAYTYLPFGAGRRGCIGESFARAEAVVLTAMITQRFTLHADRGQHVVPEPLLTLRPRRGLSMRVEVRLR